MSIDKIHPKEVSEEEGSKCLTPWILNGEPMMDLCTSRLREDQRPWCSQDEIFQGNFEFCEETEEEKLTRENKLKQQELISEAQSLIGSWDTRNSV